MSAQATAEVVRALRARYCAPEWALLEEVRNQTGYGIKTVRYADAVAMNLYPSRGLEVLGFEVKVSRSDWKNELNNPDKSTAIQKYCDRWWVVAGGKNIVQAGELPATWGLLVMQSGEKKRLVCVKEAPKLPAEPLTREFIASMLRRGHDKAEKASSLDSEELFRKGKAAGVVEGKETAAYAHKYEAKRLKELTATVERFERESGLRLSQYCVGDNLGEYVRLAQGLMSQRLDVNSTLMRAKQPLEMTLKFIESLERLARLTGERNKEEADVSVIDGQVVASR